MEYLLIAVVAVMLLCFFWCRRKRANNEARNIENNTWGYYNTVFYASTSIRSEMDQTLIFSRILIDSDQAPMISFSFGAPFDKLTSGRYKVVQSAKSAQEVHVLAGAGNEFFYSLDDAGWLGVSILENRITLTASGIRMGLGGYPGSYASSLQFNLTEL